MYIKPNLNFETGFKKFLNLKKCAITKTKKFKNGKH
jgi:hypothetical protein